MKKFSIKKDAWNNDDLQYALTNNPPETFKSEDITHIVAEVCGANDEDAWWWILKMKNKKFFLLSGSCDYTGWDCQSGIDEQGYFKTALQAAKATPENTSRKIRKNLIAQVKGKQPLFTYKED